MAAPACGPASRARHKAAVHPNSRLILKLVAFAVNRNNVAWVCWVSFQLLPQVKDVRVERTAVSLFGIAPDLGEHSFTRHQLAAPKDQEAQHFELFWRELDGLAATGGLLALKVDLHVAKAVVRQKRFAAARFVP